MRSEPKWVCGFLFNHRHSMVALIHKAKGPAPVVGKLNGIGGKIEPGEDAYYAMAREFREEAGVLVPAERWRQFAALDMRAQAGTVLFFEATATSFEFSNVRTVEREPVMWVEYNRLHLYNVVPNLHWLVPMAFDKDRVTAEVINERG